MVIPHKSKQSSIVFIVNRDHSYKKQGNKGGHLHLQILCYYSSVPPTLLPIIQSCQDELGIS